MKSGTPHKKAEYEQALALRKRGFTYSEIAKTCGVSSGTVSAWLKTLPFSEQITKQNKVRATAENKKRLSLINKARTTERAKQYNEVAKLARIEYQHYRNSPLFMMGLTLYLAEGDNSKRKTIRYSSRHPERHLIFIRFLKNYLGVEKKSLRFWLLLYKDHDEVACMKHWSKKIGITVGQFYKNQFVQSRSHRQTLHFGVGNTIIGSTLLRHKLDQWIELAAKDCLK